MKLEDDVKDFMKEDATAALRKLGLELPPEVLADTISKVMTDMRNNIILGRTVQTVQWEEILRKAWEETQE